LQRGPLVGGVVVDVHARVGPPTPHQVVDQVLDQLLLGGRVVSPPRGERARPVPEARQVFATTTVGRPGVALEVEVDVAGAGLGEPLQPATGIGSQQLVCRVASVALLHLEAGLQLQPVRALAADRRHDRAALA
jgi:hypothetical protein